MLNPEIRQSLALRARNRLYGILAELDAIERQDREATAYWKIALAIRLAELRRDATYWGLVYERYKQ